uniref:Protein 2 n=1 Tax=Senecio virus 1 TaxID=2977988 RepID=A0A9N6YJJ4_9RHAB|nr:TPA_asm: protein 2 [Senecio virus 1]
MASQRDKALEELRKKADEEVGKSLSGKSKYDGLAVRQSAMDEILRLGDQNLDEEFGSGLSEGSSPILGAVCSTPAVRSPTTSTKEISPMSDPFRPLVGDGSYNQNLILSAEEEDAMKKAMKELWQFSDREKKVFIHGYRVKQDYTNVLMAKQVRDLESVAGKLGSHSHAINSVISNLTSGVAQVMLKLTTAVDRMGEVEGSLRGWNPDQSICSNVSDSGKFVDAQPSVVPSASAKMHVQEGKVSIADLLGKTPATVASSSSKTENEKIIESNRAISSQVTNVNLWTEAEMTEALKYDCNIALGFYGLAYGDLVDIMAKFGKNLADAKRIHGANLNARIVNVLSQM